MDGVHFEQLLALIKSIRQRQEGRPPDNELTIWIEEASHPLSRFQRAPEALNSLLRTRRHKRLSWLMTTQYPSDLPLEGRRAFDRMIVGRTTQGPEIEYLKRQGFPPEALQKMPTLKPGQFFELADGKLTMHEPLRSPA